MDSDSNSPNNLDDPTTRWAFNFFVTVLGVALMAALWVLAEMAFA